MQLQVPRQGERVIAFGNSGEGKTVLLQHLFAGIHNGVAIDTKHDEDWATLGEVVTGDSIFGVGKGRYVWRPPDSFVFDDDQKEKFFAWALRAGNRAIYIDELGDICESASQYPRYLRLCIMRGRSRRLGIWGTTQEPLRVPTFLFGQAQHRFVFHVGHPKQRQLVEQMFETSVPWDRMPEGSHRYMQRVRGKVSGPWILDRNRDTEKSA